MASLQEAVVSILNADAAVVAAAPGGIHPDVLPPGVSFPAIRFITVSDLPGGQSFDGPGGTFRVRMQFDSFADNWPATNTVAAAVLAALCPDNPVGGHARTVSVSGTPVTVQGALPQLAHSEYEGTTTLYKHSRDFIVWGGA